MKKLSDKELSIQYAELDDETKHPESEIWLEGMPTGKFVPGTFLEAAISWNNFYLLFTVMNSPFEEMLDIYLLDMNLNIKDSASVGDMYNTGTFSQLELSAPNTIYFRFIGETRWKLDLLEKPVFHIPFFLTPWGVWRKFKFKKHFKIVGRPLPQGQNLLRRRAEN